MAGQHGPRNRAMTKTKKTPTPELIAVDGIDPAAILAEARMALGHARHGGISKWDASGVFEDLAVADENAGAPSARTLLLLYAADLAFRLRWQIRPALAEGRVVVAAPYVDTALAFGRAAGLKPGWLENLFSFAPRPQQRRFAYARDRRLTVVKDGFVGFSCVRMIRPAGRTRRQVMEDTAKQLLRFDR
jgi:hypothetical protein